MIKNTSSNQSYGRDSESKNGAFLKSLSIDNTTVLPARNDNDLMFCLQNNQGLRIDRSLVY